MNQSPQETGKGKERTTRSGGRRTGKGDAPDEGSAKPGTARARRSDGAEEELEPRAEDIDRVSGREETDVLLDVPVLKVDEIELEVENLLASVSLHAEVLDLLKLKVGADVELGRVHLNIKGVEAQALLKVRLDNVRDIITRVLQTIDANPQILEQVTRGVGTSLEQVAGGAGQAVGALGRGAGGAVEGVGRGAGKAVEDLGAGAGTAVEEVGAGAGSAVEDVGTGAGKATEGVGAGAGSAVEGVGTGVGSAAEDAGTAAKDAGKSAGTAARSTGKGTGTAAKSTGKGAGGAAKGTGGRARK
ncbi:hypothetical protein [Nocardiopsis tropica]|uniref:Uncharacterized protein n=1 Tax=Nocardiopsis tropica TaxID=109330 RepID=A0ABU7KTR1_9ACTN|nr:hypothetical protein [Nocardiopsis umidischolae]MEE2052695.1 hypothetical protein [Nocardiopsis umidischolae]